MLAGVILDFKMAVTKPCYAGMDKEELKTLVLEKIVPITTYLNGKQYLLGDNICYLDFYLYELFNLIDFLTDGQMYLDHQLTSDYQTNMYHLPGVKELTDNLTPKTPFNAKFAPINNFSEEPVTYKVDANEIPGDESMGNPYAKN